GPHTTTGDEDVELPGTDVATDVECLDNHLLTGERLRARIVPVMTLTGELDLVATTADVSTGSNRRIAVGEVRADRPRGVVVALVTGTPRTGTLRARVRRIVIA